MQEEYMTYALNPRDITSSQEEQRMESLYDGIRVTIKEGKKDMSKCQLGMESY